MGLVRARDATTGDEQPVDAAWQEAAQGDVVSLARRQPLQDGALAGRIVNVDRIGAAGDRIVELASLQHVLGGQPVIADEPPAFADASAEEHASELQSLMR